MQDSFYLTFRILTSRKTNLVSSLRFLTRFLFFPFKLNWKTHFAKFYERVWKIWKNKLREWKNKETWRRKNFWKPVAIRSARRKSGNQTNSSDAKSVKQFIIALLTARRWLICNFFHSTQIFILRNTGKAATRKFAHHSKLTCRFRFDARID